MTFNPNDFTAGYDDGDTVFGMPSCMLELGLKALALLAPEVLALIIDAINKAIAAARNYIADLVQPLFDWLGSVEYDSLLGMLGIKLDLGFLGVDSVLLGAVAALAGLGAVIDTLGAYYDMAVEELNDIKDCLDKFKGKRSSSITSVEFKKSDIQREEVVKEVLDIYGGDIPICYTLEEQYDISNSNDDI